VSGPRFKPIYSFLLKLILISRQLVYTQSVLSYLVIYQLWFVNVYFIYESCNYCVESGFKRVLKGPTKCIGNIVPNIFQLSCIWRELKLIIIILLNEILRNADEINCVFSFFRIFTGKFYFHCKLYFHCSDIYFLYFHLCLAGDFFSEFSQYTNSKEKSWD
jgi:hypothetical protein